MQNSKGLLNVRMSSRLRARPGVRAGVDVWSGFLFATSLEQNISKAGSSWDIWSLRSQKSKKVVFYFTFYFFLDYPFSCSNLVVSLILVHFSFSPTYQALISCFIVKGIR